MVSLLLSITFACGLLIAVAHVLNRAFIAPVYDVAANLVAFVSATAASLLLRHWAPAALSAVAVLCWLVLARRTILARRAARQRESRSYTLQANSTEFRTRSTSVGSPTRGGRQRRGESGHFVT